MAEILFSQEYERLVDLLAEWRRASGLSQRELARRLGRCQSHVHLIETRQRRVEIVEFCRYVRALQLDPVSAFAVVASRLGLAGVNNPPGRPGR